MKRISLLVALVMYSITYAQSTSSISSNKATTTELLPGGSSGGGDTGPVNSTGSSTEVGVTSGELSVSLSGTANYSIPLSIPPGINGVVPQIGLSYNSQAGVGLAGYGWNISGLSSITRIPSTKFHDGVNDPVDFDALDRFALDGQRLMLKSGTYGVVGSTYETENFSNVRISFLASGTNDYFKVEYPDGSSAYYGFSTDSKVGLLTYALTYWENPQAIRISYSYMQTNNVNYISSIKYGSVGATSPINQINFVYKNRTRIEQSYGPSGMNFINDKILDQINVKGNGVGYRNYILTYDITLDYERLTGITEKNGDNSKSFNPTIFTYQETVINEAITGLESNTILNNATVESDFSSPISGDFDGNGELDIITPNFPENQDSTHLATFSVFKGINDNVTSSNGSQFTIPFLQNYKATQLTTIKTLSGTVGNYKLLNKDFLCLTGFISSNCIVKCNYDIYSSDTNYTNLEYTKQFVPTVPIDECYRYTNVYGDFNGDGLSDVMILPFVNNGPDYPSSLQKVYFLDLDRRLTSNYVKDLGFTHELITNNKIIKTGDVNGDGKTDLIVFVGAPTNKIYVYSLDDNNNLIKLFETSYNFTPRDTSLTNYPSYGYYLAQYNIQNLPNINIIADIAIGDFNGDGKSDFILPLSTAYNTDGTLSYGKNIVFYSNGINFIPEELPFFPYIFKKYIAVDFDTDGKTDLIAYYQNPNYPNGPLTLHYIKKKNNIWTDSVQIITNILNNQLSNSKLPMFTLSKLNNSKPELVIFNKDNSNNLSVKYFVNQNDLSNQKLLKKITQGNGVSETVTYSNLNDLNNVYTSAGPIESYPNYDLPESTSGLKVVSQIERQSSSVYKKKLYKYYGATSNVEGLGFLGFRSVLKTNWFSEDSQAISNITKLDISKRGAVTENFSVLGIALPTLTLTPTDSYITRTLNTYNIVSGTYVNPLLSTKVFKLFNTSTQNFNGLDGTSSEKNVLYNANNSPIQVNTSVKNGTTIEQLTVENLGYDPAIIAPYIIDRPNNKKFTTTIYPSYDVTSQEENYVYDANLLKQIKKKATNSGATTADVIEKNEYDAYGNIITKTLIATNEVDRVSNFQYDPSTHRFLTKKVDIQGQPTDYTYNLSNGLLLSETPFSNLGYLLTTTYVYDTWGKKTQTTNYLGKIEKYNYANTADGVTKTTTGPVGEDSGSVVIIDDLGRKLHEGIKNIEGNWSYTSTFYDSNDKPILVSQPYFSGFDGLGNFDVWNEMQYDVYGRLIQSNSLKSFDSDGKQTIYNYTGLIASEDDGQKIKVTTKNSIGKVTSITETPSNGSPTTIKYAYFANGNLKTTTTSSATISIEQDGWGRKKTLFDPSAGTYKYTYNNFGETKTEEVVGKGITTYFLDNFGKVLKKSIVGSGTDTTNTLTTYSYNGTTKLLSGMTFADNANNYTITYYYGYDDFKRLNYSKESRPSFYEFQKDYTFDAYGRPEKEHFYAKDLTTNKVSDKWIKTIYKNAYKYQLYDMTNSTTVGTTKLWQTTTVNQQGKVLTASMGNGITIANSYDVYGFPTQIKHDKTTTNIMTLSTSFDPIYGNLTSRTSNLFGTGLQLWNETLQYDDFDRLTTYRDTAGIQTQDYNSNGTISSNNIGSYAYTLSNNLGSQPFTVSTITPVYLSPTYNYYKTRTQNIAYNVFKSPVSITEAANENIDFEYNAQNSRSVMYYGDQATTKNARIMRKFYSADGSMEIKRNTTTVTNDFITYIGGDGYTAPIVYKSDGTTYSYYYLHRDYQGSILAITNSTGVVVEKRLFDVWGSLIKYAGSNGVSITPPTRTTALFLDRGYTGHEHLLGVGLINMNGRIYDNKLHRFLQPDNNVQDPFNSQNYNRYGYGMNNPTKYTDPSGEFWWLIAGFIASTYIHGAQATGDANPFHWNAGQWANAAMAPISSVASSGISDSFNNYVNNYDSHPASPDYLSTYVSSPVESHSYTLSTAEMWNNISEYNKNHNLNMRIQESLRQRNERVNNGLFEKEANQDRTNYCVNTPINPRYLAGVASIDYPDGVEFTIGGDIPMPFIHPGFSMSLSANATFLGSKGTYFYFTPSPQFSSAPGGFYGGVNFLFANNYINGINGSDLLGFQHSYTGSVPTYFLPLNVMGTYINGGTYKAYGIGISNPETPNFSANTGYTGNGLFWKW